MAVYTPKPLAPHLHSQMAHLWYGWLTFHNCKHPNIASTWEYLYYTWDWLYVIYSFHRNIYHKWRHKSGSRKLITLLSRGRALNWDIIILSSISCVVLYLRQRHGKYEKSWVNRPKYQEGWRIYLGGRARTPVSRWNSPLDDIILSMFWGADAFW